MCAYILIGSKYFDMRRYFEMCAYIGSEYKSAAGDSAEPKQLTGRLLFQFRQLFYKRGFFTRCGDFNARKDFIVRLIFSKSKDFSIRLIFS
jgi:hypothetical protein